MYKIFQLPFQTQAQQEKKRNFADHENLNPGVVGGGLQSVGVRMRMTSIVQLHC